MIQIKCGQYEGLEARFTGGQWDDETTRMPDSWSGKSSFERTPIHHWTRPRGTPITVSAEEQGVTEIPYERLDPDGSNPFRPLDEAVALKGGADARVELLRDDITARLGELEVLDNISHIKAYRMNIGDAVAQMALSAGADDIDGTVGHEESIEHHLFLRL